MEKAREQRVKDLTAAVRADPASVARRLELAAALRDLGRLPDAIELYRGVALRYAEEGRFAQAIAVCRGILEIDPAHEATQELLAQVAARRAAKAAPRWPEESTEASAPSATEVMESLAGASDDAPTLAQSFEELVGGRGPEPALDPDDDLPSLGDEGGGERTDPAMSAEPPPEPPRHQLTVPGVGAPAAARAPAADGEEAALREAIGAPFPPTDEEPPPFPLLGDLPHDAFVDLVNRLRVRREPAGVTILREGEPGDACYLIASGAVRVVKAGTEVATLGAGSFFGEFALLADQRRHASVETVEPVELLEISRALLDELTSAHPGVARTLRRFYRDRLIETLVATAPFFAPLTVEERAEVASRFRPRRFGRGSRIVEEGAPGGGLYLILVGEVEVVRGEGDAEVSLAALGEGSYFGEMSLLRGGVASATVRATRTIEAVQLGPRDFYEVVARLPVLWDTLRTEAARRELWNHAILAGEARKNGDGQIYLV